MKIAINASRAKSGGGLRHMKGIINNIDESILKENKIHIWSYPELLNSLNPTDNIKKHICNYSDSNIIVQILWEFFVLPALLRKNKIDVLINVDAGSVCRFKPAISISRNMLPFEPVVTKNFRFLFKLKNKLLKFSHISSLNNSIFPIFLTNYAAETIKPYLKKKLVYKIIPHGIDKKFFIKKTAVFPISNSFPVTITYISNFFPYKNHDKVIEAVSNLIKSNFNIKLKLVGNPSSLAKDYFLEILKNKKYLQNFIDIEENVSQDSIPLILSQTNIFIFASSCENMPNTLVEGMAAGLPIACSNVGSMPEILKDGGVYFNPHEVESIQKALKLLILNPQLREDKKRLSRSLAKNFCWRKCSNSLLKTAINAFKVYQDT